MSLVTYAKSELDRIGAGEDGMQEMMNNHIIHMVEEFSKEGHSGFSANYAIGALERLLRFLPLTPLTGEDDEWNEIAEGEFQNKRDSAVFKKDGQAYDIDGYIFSSDDGETWYTNSKSRKNITFPYYPPTTPEKIRITPEDEQ